MAVLNGTIDIRISTKSEGNAAAGVKAVGTEIGKVQQSSVGARGPIAALGSTIMGLKDGVSPVESIKGAVDSLAGTFGFVGSVAGVAAAAVVGLIGALSSLGSSADQTLVSFRLLTDGTQAYVDSLGDVAAAADAAMAAAGAMRGTAADLEVELANLNGDKEGARIAELTSQLDAANEKFTRTAKDRTAAEAALTQAEAEYSTVSERLSIARTKEQALTNDLNAAIAAGNEGKAALFRWQLGVIEDVVFEADRADRDLAQKIEGLRSQVTTFDAILGTLDRIVGRREEMLVAPAPALPDPVPPRARGASRLGQGQTGRDNARADADGLRAWDNYVKEQEAAAKALREKEEADHEDWAAMMRARIGEPFRSTADDGAALASTIRDFSSALGESIPQMTEFAGALATVASSWDGVAAANDNVMQVEARWREGKATERDLLEATASVREAEAKAAIDSVGAIAKAGAEQIKNERLRAGVLSIIETGLSVAAFATGDLVGGAAHAAAALILGSVALFSGSKGGSKSQQAPRTQQLSSGQTQPTQSITQVNVYGGWYGGQSAQENAWALEQTARRHAGNGFARAA